MIDPTTGMKAGERYRVEHVERGLVDPLRYRPQPGGGNLFEPPSRARGVQDGWRGDRSPASSRMAVTALVLLSGCALALLCRKRR